MARRMCEAFDEDAASARRDVMLYYTLIAPFAEFDSMRRALVGRSRSRSAPAIGVFLMLRRMASSATPWRMRSCPAPRSAFSFPA